MMGSLRLEEENIVKDVKKFFNMNKLEKETNDDAIKDIRTIFRLEK